MNFRIKFLIIMLVLSGCSSNDRDDGRALAGVRALALAPFISTPTEGLPQGDAYIIASYENVRTPLIRVAKQNGFEQYRGVGGVKMTLRDGRLMRLRGLGQELEAVYMPKNSPPLTDLAYTSHKFVIIFEYWEDQLPKLERFFCRIVQVTQDLGMQRMDERCISAYRGLTFENRYWIDSTSQLRFSQQWFHPKASALKIDHSP